MQLYFCEKPSQAVAYAEALGFSDKSKGKGYFEKGNVKITWCYGHFLELYEPEDYDENNKIWKLETLPIIPEKFKYKVKDRVLKQYKVVQKLIKESDEVVIATDPDREGETIAMLVIERCNYKGVLKRCLSGSLDIETLKKELTKIKDAKETYPLYLSGYTRQISDWLMGMNITRGMTVANKGKVEGVLTSGRVQTPTLNLVYLRDKEIEGFIPKDYYELNCIFKHDEKGEFETNWQIPEKYLDEEEKKYCLDKKIVQEIAEKIKNKNGKIIKSNKVRKKEKHPLLYSLSALQKEASSKLNFSAKKTLDLVQSLYETHRAVTYPRTNCQYLNEEQFKEAPKVLEVVKQTDKGTTKDINELLKDCDIKIKSQCWDDKKITAHHAIIPTLTASDINRFSDDEKKIYDMIRRKYIAQFLPLAESDTTTIIVECENEHFKATGTISIIEGWKKAFPDKNINDKELPSLFEGEDVFAKEVKLLSKKTQPPPSYTEGSLLDGMINCSKYVQNEKLKKILSSGADPGIGTEATRAGIIEGLFKRDYLEKKGKKIKITPKGIMLIELVPSLAKSIETTAYWEMELEKIANKESTVEKFLDSQIKGLKKMVEDIKAGKSTAEKAVGSQYTCPKCESGLKRLKSKKTGKYFWVCLDRDNCGQILPDNRGKPGAPIEKVDQGTKDFFCKKCPDHKLIRKKGPYGYYWNCSNCKQNYKENDKNEPILEIKKKPTSDYKCPNCKEGYLVERKGKNGVFWGCNSFPKCKTIVKDNNGKPEGF